ncbi:MAG TPA: 3-dehydroquinate synthase [bacterium]|nr:3-dehydroquinate synthase [bacterium]
MKEIKVNLGERSYRIVIGSGLIREAGKLCGRVVRSKRAVIVTNQTVARHYLDPVEKSLESAGFVVSVVKIPDGERHKTLRTLEYVCGRFAGERLDRASCVVALGGGVIGDLAGFAASAFMRGIDLVQVPTTLLSQVDSSVGGKTGVNLKEGKNLVGAFYQPRLVLIDPAALKTLPVRELRAGFAEVIKYGVICDKSFFSFLERNIAKALSCDPAVMEKIVAVSCDIKAKVVEDDEREGGLRAILNFGHTVGHAVEAATGYRRYLHGEAVSLGMAAAARIAVKLAMIDAATLLRLENLLRAAGLPVAGDGFSAAAVMKHIVHDKKASGGRLRFVLPHEIGRVAVSDAVPVALIREAVREISG